MSEDEERNERLLIVEIPKRVVEPLGNVGLHRSYDDATKRSLASLQRAVGELPTGMMLVDCEWDMRTQRLLVVVHHPRLRLFKDGDTIFSVNSSYINRHGWESIMEKS